MYIKILFLKTTVFTFRDKVKINFIEDIIPKVEYTLKTFNPELLKGVNDKTKSLKEWISFCCEFCGFDILGQNKWKHLVQHFKDVHKDELAVLCCECRQQFDIRYLAENRWAHSCSKLVVMVD